MEMYTNIFLISYGAIGVFHSVALLSFAMIRSIDRKMPWDMFFTLLFLLPLWGLFWPFTFGIVIGFMLADGLEKHELLEKLKLAEAKAEAKAQ